MKRAIFILFLSAVTQYCNSQSRNFLLKGSIKQLPDSLRPDWLFLSYTINEETIIDSVKPTGGKYTFSGTLAQPVLAAIRIKFKPLVSGQRPVFKQDRDLGFIFLDFGAQEATSTSTLSNIKVSNSKAHKEYISLMDSVKSYDKKLQPLYEEYFAYQNAKDKAGLDRVQAQIMSLENELKDKVYAQYVRKKPGSPVALYAVEQYAGWNIDPDKAEPLYNKLAPAIKRYPGAVGFKEQLELAKKTGIGKIAMDFVQNDTLDNPVKLSTFRGKYVLLEFWASWCVPCRAENPNLVRIFNKYKDRNFHVIGIALERPGQKNKWLKAIHDDSLVWTQVSDMKYFNSQVAVQYGIKAIPQNILINPEGRIIAKNLRGNDLEEKLAEEIEGKK